MACAAQSEATINLGCDTNQTMMTKGLWEGEVTRGRPQDDLTRQKSHWREKIQKKRLAAVSVTALAKMAKIGSISALAIA